MKFMQRAAAASPSSPSTPGTPDQSGSNKRQRTEDSPLPFNVNELADQKAVRDALEAEEKRTQAALDKAASDAGDTRWVLNFEGKREEKKEGAMRVQQLSFANIDRAPPVMRAVEEEGDRPIGGGRRSFGKFNRKLEVCNTLLRYVVGFKGEEANRPNRSYKILMRRARKSLATKRKRRRMILSPTQKTTTTQQTNSSKPSVTQLLVK